MLLMIRFTCVGYTQKVVIIGAGISGLACAYRLKQLGAQCYVLEAGARPGGIIATARRDGYLFELGPQCPRFPAPAWRLVRELQLEKEFIAGDPAAKRYIFRYGTLHPAPFSPAGLLTTRLVKLSSKIRILSEALRFTQPPPQEETLGEFANRKFGADVVDNLADPIISTVFFGDVNKMGMESAFPALVDWERKHGSLVRGAIRARNSKRQADATHGRTSPVTSRTNSGPMKVTDALPALGSFRSGMARLPERLAEELREEIRYGIRVERVTEQQSKNRESRAVWQIGLSDGETITAEQVVLSLPAFEAARVVERSVPALARELSAIEYSPIGGVSSGYDRKQVQNRLQGFGFMVPRKEGIKTICTFWNSSLFPERAPEGKVLMTSFVQSESSAETLAINEEVLSRTVEAENAGILGITGKPEIRHAWIHPRALPQYNVGHGNRVAAIYDVLPTLPGLHLAGNYLKGRSIGECVELAFEVAEKVHSQLGETNIQAVTHSSEE
jgi:protoporphyrinogen/coproporphyrinogen III oxidase